MKRIKPNIRSFTVHPSPSRAKRCDDCDTPSNGRFLLRAPGDQARYVCRSCYDIIERELANKEKP